MALLLMWNLFIILPFALPYYSVGIFCAQSICKNAIKLMLQIHSISGGTDSFNHKRTLVLSTFVLIDQTQ